MDALLLAYFYVIDPTVKNQQGNDIGTQYQTGVYYTNDRQGKLWNELLKSNAAARLNSM